MRLTRLARAGLLLVLLGGPLPASAHPLLHMPPLRTAPITLLAGTLALLWSRSLRRRERRRKARHEQLAERLQFHGALLDNLPTPLFVRDPEGRLQACNRAYEECLGQSLADLRGSTLEPGGRCPDELVERLRGEYRQLLESRLPRRLDCRVEIDGKSRYLDLWLTPFYNARGRLQGLLGGWSDISERKRLEFRLRQAQRAAEAASAAKGEYLAHMSHELRTPLNSLVGLLELEQRRVPSDNLRVARQSALLLMELAGNILDLDRLDDRRMPLQPQPVDLPALLRDSLALFAATAREKQLRLHLDCQLPAARRYKADPLRLRQVLHNLLGNALKFTDHGSIRLAVEEAPLDAGRSRLTFSVSDTGIGIPAAARATLFEPPSQASAPRAHPQAGAGLGLSICKRLVELMGGRIWLDSPPGKGCRIAFELALTWEAATDAASPGEEPAPVAGRALQVLVVDDVSSNALVLRQQLRSLGHHAVTVASAEAALAAWEEQRFDVLISDCNLPGMSGYALCRTLRERERRSGRPPCLVLGYTANALAGEGRRCREAGMQDLLTKPVTLRRLRQVLDRHAADQPAAGARFDLAHLLVLEGTGPGVKEELLEELRANLIEESARLLAPLAQLPPEAALQLLHRLEGLACIIDAPDLLRTCQATREALGQDAEALWQRQETLLASLSSLLDDIERHLSDAGDDARRQIPYASHGRAGHSTADCPPSSRRPAGLP